MPKYIEANILRMKLREKFRTQFDWNDVIDADDLETVIQQIPTADVQVRNGKWAELAVDVAEHPFHCSVCGWSNNHIQQRYILDFNYCPHCGARMDK